MLVQLIFGDTMLNMTVFVHMFCTEMFSAVLLT